MQTRLHLAKFVASARELWRSDTTTQPRWLSGGLFRSVARRGRAPSSMDCGCRFERTRTLAATSFAEIAASPANIGRKHPAEPVPPKPDRLVTDIDAPLKKQILDIAQAQREPHVRHHHELNHLRRRVEITKRRSWFSRSGHSPFPHPRHVTFQSGAFVLTMPAALTAAGLIGFRHN